MSKKALKSQTKTTVPGLELVQQIQGFKEYRFKSNDLRLIYKKMPGTGVITSNILYRVGARDEDRGETGLAHMLEHMLFKPTKADLKAKVDSGVMQFERETGCILNANTWKDRTTYFFSYPKEHFTRALALEAERMTNVVISDKEFLPERGNVLSEFDMYFGDPEFALAVAMVGATFQNHPYGHETIGSREDIEDYTSLKLNDFYKLYYRPDNATLMIVGDIDETIALSEAKRAFGHIEKPTAPIRRIVSREPKVEGRKEVVIKRPSSTNLLALGVHHQGFPGTGWYETLLGTAVLAEGPESILHKKLVDTGKVTSLSMMLEPTYEPNLAVLYVTLAAGHSHAEIEKEILDIIAGLSVSDCAKLIKKEITHQVTMEAFAQTSSLSLVRNLTEHAAANDWPSFTKSIKTLEAIKPAAVLKTIKQQFTPDRMTIGKFIGTTS